MDEDGLYKQINQALVKARGEAGLTQTKLAKVSGVSRSTIAMVESRSQRPSVAYLYQVAPSLGVTPQQLLPEMSEVKAPLWEAFSDEIMGGD